jgi:hypothetical protein
MRLRRSLTVSLALGVLVLTLVAVTPVARWVLSSNTLDASYGLGLPGWLNALLEESVVAYPAHAALGTLLGALDLSPPATAVQWLKAAGHASSDADLDRAARGISAAFRRDEEQRQVIQTICKLRELGNADQVSAVARSGVPCERWTPEVRLDATATPSVVSPGTTLQVIAVVTSATDMAGLVDLEIHDAAGAKVAQWVFQDQTLAADWPTTYVANWEVPSTLPAGEYEVKLGVFQAGWTVVRGWKNTAATITVHP